MVEARRYKMKQKSFNIYLAIDGVLLANELNLANHAQDFLKYILTTYPDTTYWLTTHCRGDAHTPIQRFGHFFDEETVTLMKRIKPTNWNINKTEAIDFETPFLWFDDDLFEGEKIDLMKHNTLDSWCEIDLAQNENQLLDILNLLNKAQ